MKKPFISFTNQSYHIGNSKMLGYGIICGLGNPKKDPLVDYATLDLDIYKLRFGLHFFSLRFCREIRLCSAYFITKTWRDFKPSFVSDYKIGPAWTWDEWSNAGYYTPKIPNSAYQLEITINLWLLRVYLHVCFKNPHIGDKAKNFCKKLKELLHRKELVSVKGK